ncbi:GntR family transcriptional regulator [Nocardia mexicana]|uniref:GntR family transcriptional regulator n=1 Tax=Nocardia mexicana TaxID=279262 RepID=A0A370HFE3_9NOCA|nr:GntR family transcriptional regulator [Nocardia mexicana]RDI55957.1 GntR family transcriptional regulator [Nocardia mexicana]
MADNLIRIRGNRGRQQLPEEVAAYVRELIMSGQVRPGEFLRMEPIAEAVGVSNTPVREGLLALRSEGFVELVPRRGFVVAPVSQQDVHDLFWAQAQFAAELAVRAAGRITSEQIEELEAINAKLGNAIGAGDRDAAAGFGHDFHRHINLTADSHRLTLLLGSVVRHLPNRFYASLEGRLAASGNDHPQLIEALRARDAQRAGELTERHILDGAQGVLGMLDQRGPWHDPVTDTDSENTDTGPEK